MSPAAITPSGNAPSMKNLNAATQTKQRVSQNRAVAQAEKEQIKRAEKKTERTQPGKQIYRQENSAEQANSRGTTRSNRIDIKG
ncbi:MAG: hypothetical protein HQM02_03605 [Magnetococcales bacterium]|nr:hypothetical protein [Magnetococcales bacterium]